MRTVIGLFLLACAAGAQETVEIFVVRASGGG